MIYASKINNFISSIDVVNINLDSKPSWFLRKNPLGLVPAIQNKEFVAYESDIVVDYLVRIFSFILKNSCLGKYYTTFSMFQESKYPEPRLQPESPEDRARDACFLHLFNKKMVRFFKKSSCFTLICKIICFFTDPGQVRALP